MIKSAQRTTPQKLDTKSNDWGAFVFMISLLQRFEIWLQR